MASLLTNFRTALVSIINGDSALQSLMGRTSQLIVTWKSLRADELPVIVYRSSGLGQTSQNGDTRSGTLFLTAFVDGNNALQRAEAIMARCATILTHAAFLDHHIDFAPLILAEDSNGDTDDEFDAGDREGSRNLERADLEIELTIQAALPPQQ